MNPFSPDDVTRMRATAQASMMDICNLLNREQVGQDARGLPQWNYVVREISVCGFNPSSSKEVMDGTEVAVVDAVLRLPLGTDIDNLDRVQITHKLGMELDTKPIYDVSGPSEVGPTTITLNLRLATDGSNDNVA